jgi:MarR family transcriptional regulator, organic hydroperoxide resistance regulator
MNEMGDRLGHALARHRHVHHRYIQPRVKALGVFRGQPPVLLTIAEQPGISQVELARCVHVQPPTLARTIDRIEEANFVTRTSDPDDHRINRISLTDHGRETVKQLRVVHDAEHREIFSVLTVTEQEQLCSLLDRITERYESIIEETP